MSELKFCPGCGAPLVPGDRFCGDCGFDAQSIKAGDSGQSVPPNQPEGLAPPSGPKPDPAVAQNAPATAPPLTAAQTPPPGGMAMPPPTAATGSAPLPGGSQPAHSDRNPGMTGEIGRGSGGNQNALLIMVALLAVLFLGGGGVYWWLSKDEPGGKTSVPGAAVTQQTGSPAAPAGGQNGPSAPAQTVPQADLSRAATYLSQPGLEITALVNYPDGTVGVVKRTSAKVVSHPAIKVSEAETGTDQGEDFGFGFHYVERADGTYYILDNTPDEIFPVLKNNLTVGQTWNYQDESGQITWKVMDMGVNLDLGFTIIENCLIVHEDNRMVDFQALTYYAPGKGIVAVKNPGGKDDFYKMTAITTIDPAQAAATVKKWSPNYAIIKDDRTQS